MSALAGRHRARVLRGLSLAGAMVVVIVVGVPVTTAAPATPPAAVPPLGTIVLHAIAPGYDITSQGPLDPTTFAPDSPDPAATGRALATLGRSVDTYERVWSDGSHTNGVQDLLARFSSPAAAEVFLRAAEHALDSGEIVSAGPLSSVPGASRTVYFGTSSRPGVGEAITMRAGDYVALVSFFSAGSGHPRPISPAEAARVAGAQQAAMARARGGTDRSSRGVTLSSLGWAALAVAVLAAAVATPLVLRRRRTGERAAP